MTALGGVGDLALTPGGTITLWIIDGVSGQVA